MLRERYRQKTNTLMIYRHPRGDNAKPHGLNHWLPYPSNRSNTVTSTGVIAPGMRKTVVPNSDKTM